MLHNTEFVIQMNDQSIGECYTQKIDKVKLVND